MLRFFHRLSGEPQIGSHILRRWPFHLRHLAAQLCPVCIKSPTQRRRPSKAALDQADLQLWKGFEYTLENQTHHLVLHRVHQTMVVLDIELRPAAGRWRTALRSADVQANRQAVRLGSGKYRPVAAMPERLRRFRAKL